MFFYLALGQMIIASIYFYFLSAPWGTKASPAGHRLGTAGVNKQWSTH